MHLIEALFGIAPDRGSGLLELGLIVLVSVVLSAAGGFLRSSRVRGNTSQQ
jgi:hypothetical protein